ncbi:6890_t:CDS:1, partial [Racocetra persica]
VPLPAAKASTELDNIQSKVLENVPTPFYAKKTFEEQINISTNNQTRIIRDT